MLFQIHVIKCLYVHLGTWLWYRCKREKKKKTTPQLVSFLILKMSERICSSLTLRLCKANPHNSGDAAEVPICPPSPSSRLCCAHTHRAAQEIQREAECLCHLKDVKGDAPVTIKAFLSAPPIINHFQNCSWLFNFFHLEDL